MKCNMTVGHACFIYEEDKKCKVEEVQAIFYKNFQRTVNLYGKEITAEALEWLVDKIKQEKI